MERRFFEKYNSDGTVSTDANNTNATVPGASINQNGHLHTFRVLVNQRLEPSEQIAVTGECSSLGSWLPAKCVHLNRENGE